MRNDPEGQILWRKVALTARPLKGRIPPPPPDTPVRQPEAPPVTAQDRRGPPVRRGGNGIDGRTEDRLRRGRLPIEGRLDLHGCTQAEAHRRLTGFVAESHRAGRRCVLVITGKGFNPEARGPEAAVGVLKRQLPRWIAAEPNGSRVLAMAQAQPRHGGGGAFYLYLRRRRP